MSGTSRMHPSDDPTVGLGCAGRDDGGVKHHDRKPGDAELAEILFTAYAEDCLVHGRLDLSTGRLSDFLNDRTEIALSQVVVQAQRDGRWIELEALTLEIADLCAVQGRGSRGDAARRIRTRPWPINIDVGDYNVVGLLHAPPGVDALAAMVRRKPMIPITDATISFTLDGRPHKRDVETLLVNRQLIGAVHPAVPELAFALQMIGGRDPRAKDFTGLIYAA